MNWDYDWNYLRGVPRDGLGRYIGHITPIDHGHPRSDRPRLTRADRKRIHQRRNRRRVQTARTRRQSEKA